MKLPDHIAFEDDERDTGKGIIVQLQWGYSYEPNTHKDVKCFDTFAEARHSTRKCAVHPCDCYLCVDGKRSNEKNAIRRIRNIGPNMIEVYGPYRDLQFPFFNWEKKIAEKHPGETMDYDRVLISYDTPVAAYLAHSPSIPGGGVFVQQEGQAASQKTRRHINKWVKTLGEYYSSLSLHNGVDPWWNPATEEQIQAILDDLFDMGPPGMGLREHINEWGRHYFEVEL